MSGPAVPALTPAGGGDKRNILSCGVGNNMTGILIIISSIKAINMIYIQIFMFVIGTPMYRFGAVLFRIGTADFFVLGKLPKMQ